MKTIEEILRPVEHEWIRQPKEKRENTVAFKKWVKKKIMQQRITPIRPIYGPKGCTICGQHASTCPGWHTPDDRRIAEKVTVKQTDRLPGFDPLPKAREQLRLT